ncbi:phosphoinositide binding protein [Theileria orientalis strain Shintoku]|uniref:Phosphoinositide binding protein n=1 Tax=Theileria orientalis strain Shintoku TaxID=869250 RepID=J4D9X7_THEOR|nr:phosphoinositide binding protein [Theileria orientalis strain Shintoku]PVC52008.1 phosphoinositide binding protein [Theileria orientalis]BAM41660.1 phosphoinositide binding protein [Theileria orientalis strain Shintoku]|eukprot:XP_009691961.1 phosphoinositide binding protein [Theileria orientalis strain Shintoku]
MDFDGSHSVLYGSIEIPTSHVNPYALDESVLLYEPMFEDILSSENRYMFNNVPISENEEKILEEFMRYISEECMLKNRWNSKEDTEWLYVMEPEFLRFLYSAKFDYKKSLEWIFLNYQFRNSSMLPATLDDIEHELKEGYLYWFGRDKRCRPTLVADVFKLQSLSIEKLVKLIVFCFEFFLRYLHVGGKSENYNVLIDCDNKGIVNLPVQMIIQLTEIMHSKYRGRLNKLYLVDSPNLINMVIKPLRNVLPEGVLKKIVVLKDNSKEVLLSQYSAHQLQQKFGGTHPNLTRDYYPFHFFPNATENVPNGIVEDPASDRGSSSHINSYTILKLPKSILYGTCMVLNKNLCSYMCTPGVSNPSESNELNSSDASNKWLKNIRHYILSKETVKYLATKMPQLMSEIESSVIRNEQDLERFINNIN